MRILFKTNYKQDLNLAKHSGHRFWYGLLILVLFTAPLILDGYYIGEATRVLIFAMAGLGTADIGWVTGHSYVVYAPLLHGATQIMYEGAPDFPDMSRI